MSAWLDALRAACEESSQRSIAQRLGYSVTVVSQVLTGNYKGDLARVQAAVEGALLQVEVDCPVCGLIPRQRCIEHQRRPFTPTNPASVQLYRACRSGCPHSLLPQSAQLMPTVQPAVTHNTGSPSAVPTPTTGVSRRVIRPTDRRKRSTQSNQEA